MTEPMMKGGILREYAEWYESQHGSDRMRELAANLPEDLRGVLDPDEPTTKLLAASWYPARLSHLVLDRVTMGMSDAQIERFARDSTRHLVARGMSGVYRFVLRRVVTPELYALSVDRIWRQWHTTGQREVTITSPTTAKSIVRRWEGHHPVLCTITIETMCAVLETMGCKGLHWKRTACVSRGAKECVTLLEWTK
jgi:hypothetical protein